jgi:phosphate starvation-inducible PhoH-like protein|tara:strand:- start:375 stop:1076 length:702 start_codon:yes stop_codon:yes gene_type:complete
MSQQKPKPKVARLVTKHDTKKKSISVLPKNPAQKNYLDTLWSKAEQVVVFGPSGTGKTYLVSTVAASLYNTKDVNKIVITRPHVAVGEKLGFLPGDLREKCEPWALPVLDVLDTHLGKGAVDTGIKNGNIEVAPMAMMRGRSFSDSFIICDEAQNITYHELKMLLTRVGEGSKLVLNGDIMQSDLREGDGLTKIIELIKKYELPVPIVEFGVDDIVRSANTKMWVTTFMKEGA